MIDYSNDNLRDLQNQLCSSDKETFFMDTRLLCWDEYMLSYVLGTRKYYLKDDPSTLPRARRIFLYLYIADRLFKIVLGIFIIWIIYTWIISVKLANDRWTSKDKVRNVPIQNNFKVI